jgi:hypothetical protein
LLAAIAALVIPDGNGNPEPHIAIRAEDRYPVLFPSVEGEPPGGDAWASYSFAAPASVASRLGAPPGGPCPQWQDWARQQGFHDVRTRVEVTVTNPSEQEVVIEGLEVEGNVSAQEHSQEFACVTGGADVDYFDLSIHFEESIERTQWMPGIDVTSEAFPELADEVGQNGAASLGVGQRMRLPTAKTVNAGEPLRFRVGATAAPGVEASWRLCVVYSVGAEPPDRQCTERADEETFETVGPTSDARLYWTDSSWQPEV